MPFKTDAWNLGNEAELSFLSYVPPVGLSNAIVSIVLFCYAFVAFF